jgi:hypothetical protein
MVTLEDLKFKKGIFITMRGYSLDARQLAQKHSIELLDEADLIEYC